MNRLNKYAAHLIIILIGSSIGCAGNAAEEIVLLDAKSRLPSLVLDPNTPSCLELAANDFLTDFYEATGHRLAVKKKVCSGVTIIAGVVDSNRMINEIEKRGLIDLSSVRGQWESFLIQPVLVGSHQTIVVVGSDPRGAMFGLYELSERLLGTDPLKLWTGFVPERLNRVVWHDGTLFEGPPTFRYRGFFLNDEDSLLGWKSEDRVVEHEIYEKVLETICRLKGNMIAPAMYARYMTPETQQLVHDRGLFYTASHLEILLTNPSIGYWGSFTHQLTGERLPYSYVRHPEEMRSFWRDSVQRHQSHLAIWPIGLRSSDDRDFVESDPSAPKTVADRAALTGAAIRDQLDVLRTELGNEAAPLTSLTMRGEVHAQYKTGKIGLPDETLLIWQDAGSWGTMEDLPKGDECQHPGGNGVYYHLSYCDNQWVQWVPLGLIQQEFRKIVEAQATRYVLFNVGDMREIPLTMAGAMDLAWKAEPWLENSNKPQEFLLQWTQQYFGEPSARAATDVYNTFYELEYPARVTSVAEVIGPLVTTGKLAPVWDNTSAIDYASEHGGAKALPDYTARQTFSATGPRHGKVGPDYLKKMRPQWDELYRQALVVFETIPAHRQQFFFDNLILQIQTSRQVNAWACEIIDAFNACTARDFSESALCFDRAAEAMEILIAEREKACHGEWENWFRGEYHHGWQNSLWALKPEMHARDCKTLSELMRSVSE